MCWSSKYSLHMHMPLSHPTNGPYGLTVCSLALRLALRVERMLCSFRARVCSCLGAVRRFAVPLRIATPASHKWALWADSPYLGVEAGFEGGEDAVLVESSEVQLFVILLIV